MQPLSLAKSAWLLLQLPRPWMVALLAALVLATPGQSQLRLFDRRDEELALRSELSVLTSQLGAVEQVLSELLQGSGQPDNLLNVLDQLNRQDGFVLSATITALQDRLRNAEGALSEEEVANLRLAYEEAQRRYVRVQSLRSRIARQMSEGPASSGGELPDAQTGQQGQTGTSSQGGDPTQGQLDQGQANQGQTNQGQTAPDAMLAVEQLQADARRLANQLARSQEQLKQAQAAAEAAQQALTKRQAEAAQLNDALRQTQTRLEDSQANAGDLRQALHDLEAKRAALASKAADSQARLDAANTTLAEVQSRQQDQARTLAAVLLRAEQAEAELARAQTALDKDDSQARLALLEREGEIARLQDSLTDLNTRLGDQQGQLESLTTERDALQQAVAERDQALVAARLAQAEIRDAVKAQVADQKAQIDRLKLALSQRDAELALTATALAGKQEALATTLTRIETLEARANDLAGQVTERDAALAIALSETEQAKATQNSLQQALAAAERRAQGLEAQLAQAQDQAQAQADQQSALLAQQEQSLVEARALADQQRQAIERPQLALPQQAAWSFEARFGSLGHRLTAAQRRSLRKALASKPAGGCLVISAGADPRPIKSGYSVKTNSELASLRALSLLRGLQNLDKQAAENTLVLGLAEFRGLEQEAAAQRSAKLVWVPDDCAQLIRSVARAPDR